MKSIDSQIEIKLVRSPNGALPRHRETVKGLGLRRMHQVVVVEDTPSIRGMVKQIEYMLSIKQVGKR